jgi:hypothetical protein
MTIAESILTSMIASVIIGVFSLFVDYKLKKKYITNVENSYFIYSGVLRFFILIIFLIPLLIYSNREQPRLSIYQTTIMVSYHEKTGLKMTGDFAGGKNKHIYILARPILQTKKEVWTVIKEVVSIDYEGLRWQARLNFSGLGGEVMSGNMYAVIGLMTEKPLVVRAQIETVELRKIKSAITKELEIKIREVSDD